MPFVRDIGEVIETSRSGSGLSIEWRIPDFLSLEGKVGDWYNSPYFSCCDGNFYLSVYPHGMRERSYALKYLSLFLFMSDECLSSNVVLNISLGIRGAEGIEKIGERCHKFSDEDHACLWHAFYPRMSLRGQNSLLMMGNVLVLTLEIKSDKHCVTKGGGERALKDFGKLLASGENSDVTIQVGDVEYKVHSLILFARSRALSVSLQHDSKEKASRKIVVEDCEPDAFRDFLYYLYTGSAQSLSEKTVFDLYRIADKYLAEDLKQHCLDHIEDTLSVQTFCDSVKLAVAYSENDLLQKAIDFATKNIRSIVRSVEWQDFNCKHPTEANEVLIKSLGPP